MPSIFNFAQVFVPHYSSARMNLHLVDGETGETLEAALAFIEDEYGHDLSGQNSASGPSSPDTFDEQQETINDQCGNLTLPSIVSSVTPRSTKGFRARRKETVECKTGANGARRNRSRDRQRLEILLLRAEAQVLEKRIDEMRDKQSKRDQDAVEWVMDGIAPGSVQLYQATRCDSLLFDVWKDLAKRHRKLRNDSESANRSLRDIYTTQLATISMLKNLLQNQEKMKRSVYLASKYYVQSCFDADDRSLVVMDRLRDTLYSLHGETDRVLRSNGLAAIMSTFTQTNMNQSSEAVTNVEVLNCRMIPFELKAVGDAFWYEMTKNYVANEIERGQPPKSAKETAMQQAFTMELDDDSIRAKIQCRYAGNREIAQTREVIALSGQSQLLEAFGMAFNGIHIQEKLWLVLSKVSPRMTVVKVCMALSIQFDCEVPNRQQFSDQLCGMLGRVKQLGFESILQGAEHSLLVT